MDRLEFHPLANIFPMMSDEELNDLGADMLEHGQREPIALFEGMILDGRNRYRACLLKGIEPRFLEQRPADPVAFVVSANLHRRQLNAGQRALIVETLATMRQGERTDLQPSAMIAKGDQATVAKLGKVSPRTMSTAKALKRDAIPSVVDAVKRGEVPIAQAASFAKATPPRDQARLIAEHGSPAAAVNALDREGQG
jgi:ParB-like chromosome segregation protein Spo0J